MTARVTRSASKRVQSVTPTINPTLIVVESLAGEILELIKSPSFRCSDDLRRELTWIICTAYDGRRMICEIQHALYSRKLAIDWFVRHLNGLRQRHGWIDNRPSSSTSTATCICGDTECPNDSDGQRTLLEFGSEKSDKLDEYLRQTGLADSTGIPPQSTSSCEEPRGIEVVHVTRLRNGLYAAPLASGGVAITTTLTPSTDSGAFAVFPNVPEPLIVSPESRTIMPTTTTTKRRETFRNRHNKPTRRRSAPPTLNPTGHTPPSRRPSIKRMVRKAITAAIATAVLTGATGFGVCLATRISMLHEITLRIA